MPDSDPTNSTRPQVIGAGLWVAAFCVFFNSFDLLNNPDASRKAIWEEVPYHLLDLINPPLPAAGKAEIPSGWQYFRQRFDLMGTAAAIFAGAWGLGHLFLRVVKPSAPERSLERCVLATTSGLALISLVTLGLGLLGIMSQIVTAAILVVSFIVELVLRFFLRGGTGGRTNGGTRRYSIWQAALLGAMILFGWCMLLGAMLPSNDFDVNEYHLEGPKEWFQNGRIAFLPLNVYTSFPFLTEMLSLTGMNLRGDWYRGATAGKTLLMAFAPLTALTLFCLGRRWFSESAGWLAAAVYLTTPWVYRISTIAYTEGALLCYLSVALLAFDLARTESTRGNWFLVGFGAGSAMACKYPGLVSVVIPIGAAAAWHWYSLRNSAVDRPASLSWTKALLFAAAGLCLSIGPWLVKNLVQTGNPVYPLAWSIFGGDDWDAELDRKWRDAHFSSSFELDDLGAKLIDVVARTDYQSPLIFAFAPLAFLFAGRPKLAGWLWLYVIWIFATWWLLTHRLDRFWLPLIPLASLLAGAGLSWSRDRIWQRFAGLIVAAALLFNFALVTSPLAGLNLYLADEATLADSQIVQPYDIAYLNQNISADQKVLLVGQANVLYARFPFVYNTVFDHSLFEEWCGRRIPDSNPPQWELLPVDKIRANFARHGVTHVAVNWSEIVRYRTTYRYTDFALPVQFDRLVAAGVLKPPVEIVYPEPLEKLDPSTQREIERNLSQRVTTQKGQKFFTPLEIYEVVAK